MKALIIALILLWASVAGASGLVIGTGMTANGVGRGAGVILLIQGGGANGTNVFVDDSPYARATTTGGNLQYSNASTIFAPTSILSDGTADYVTVPDDAIFDMQAGSNYTIEAWVNATADALERTIIARSTGGGVFEIFREVGTGVIKSFYTVAAAFKFTSSAGAIPTGTWVHVVLMRRDGSSRLYFNGTNVTAAPAVDNSAWDVTSSATFIGSYTSTGFSWNGYLEGIRWTRGIAYYPWGGFTPPNRRH